MNDKLVYRAAMVYHKWMLEQESDETETISLSISRDLQKALAKTEEISRWVKAYNQTISPRRRSRRLIVKGACQSIIDEMLPELCLDTSTCMSRVSSYLSMMSSKNIQDRTVIAPSFLDIIEEIKAINEAWPETTFLGRKLTVLIKNVKLSDSKEEVSLGDFRIILDLTDPSDKDSLDIESVHKCKSAQGYYHPHVEEEGLCMGTGINGGKERMCYALYQGRLEDYFRIIEAILRTYNGDNPFAYLSDWYNPDHEGEFCCNNCNEYRPEDQSYYCSGCESQYCSNCNSDGGCCCDCGEWKCNDCIIVCENCCEIVCGACQSHCSNCANPSCSSCLEECKSCSNNSCSSCRESCSSCQTNICYNCNAGCDCCDNPCCEECSDEKCIGCLGTICKECQNNCDNCNKTLCTGCNQNKCEDCGESMCESCEEKHNCILTEVND